MLYRVKPEHPLTDIAVVAVDARPFLRRSDVFITTGGAANGWSDIRPTSDLPAVLREVGEALDREYWSETDESAKLLGDTRGSTSVGISRPGNLSLSCSW
jgi:hypothetical protein